MSDEKSKPFATVKTYGVVDSSDESGWVRVDGHDIADCGDADDAHEACVHLNAAVEHREAQWLGALKTAIDALHAARIGLTVAVPHPDPRPLKIVAEAIKAIGLVRGDDLPPDYVPAEKLRTAEETIAKMKAGFEALNPDEHVNGELFAKFLVANGWAPPEDTTLTLQTPFGAVKLRANRDTPPGVVFSRTAQGPELRAEQLGPITIADLFRICGAHYARSGFPITGFDLHPSDFEKICADMVPAQRWATRGGNTAAMAISAVEELRRRRATPPGRHAAGSFTPDGRESRPRSRWCSRC